MKIVAAMSLALLVLDATPAHASMDEACEAVKEKDYAEAEQLARPLAVKGDAAAQLVVGYLHYNRGSSLPNNQEMVSYLNNASAQGNAMAKHIRGHFYKYVTI